LNEGNDIVRASISYTIGATSRRLVQPCRRGQHLVGNSGENNLNGRGGQDFLTGNGGNDTFQFQAGEAGGDVIADFTGNGAAAGDRASLVSPGVVEIESSAEPRGPCCA
jgi:hypothetical protein